MKEEMMFIMSWEFGRSIIKEVYSSETMACQLRMSWLQFSGDGKVVILVGLLDTWCDNKCVLLAIIDKAPGGQSNNDATASVCFMSRLCHKLGVLASSFLDEFG